LPVRELLIASFARLRAVDPGFDVSNLITVRFGRMPAAYNEEDAKGLREAAPRRSFVQRPASKPQPHCRISPTSAE
jgi:hypothetical protein